MKKNLIALVIWEVFFQFSYVFSKIFETAPSTPTALFVRRSVDEFEDAVRSNIRQLDYSDINDFGGDDVFPGFFIIFT